MTYKFYFNCLILAAYQHDVELLSNLLEPYENFKLVFKCRSTTELISFLPQNKVDLIFVDVSNFNENIDSFLKSLASKYCVIVLSPLSNYAAKSYENGIFDFILKPVNPERLATVVKNLISTRNRKFEGLFLQIKINRELVLLRYEEINYIEAYGNYVKIYTENDCLLSLEKISALENRLINVKFLRVHKSYLVNLDKIKFISKGIIHLDKNNTIPIGGTYKVIVQKSLRFFTPYQDSL